MISELFVELVGVLAVIYAGISKFLQHRLVDRSMVEGIQAESKKLNEEIKRAKEKGNQKEMEKVMKKQMEFLPKMNKVMIAQFKPMIFIIAVFFAFTWVVGQIDPNTQDDIRIPLLDDGRGCDERAEDGMYSACIEPENPGKWVANVYAYRNGVEVAFNATYFSYAAVTDDSYTEAPRGQELVVSTDKRSYGAGETVKLYAQADDVSSVEATLDNGTAFRVDLPLTIPLLNVQRIYQPYWWFILIALIVNLSLSLAMKKMRKKK